MTIMLKRHKKNGYEGFNYFVNFLESLGTNKQRNFIETASLEDPVYMSWIKKNMMNLDFLFELTTDDLIILKNNTAYFFEQIFHAFEFRKEHEKNKIDVHLTDEQIATRRANWKEPALRSNTGILRKYAKTVSSASEGCVTDEF